MTFRFEPFADVFESAKQSTKQRATTTYGSEKLIQKSSGATREAVAAQEEKVRAREEAADASIHLAKNALTKAEEKILQCQNAKARYESKERRHR